MVKESEKMLRLQKMLSDLGDKTAIVFCNTKKTVDLRTKDLEKAGFRVMTHEHTWKEITGPERDQPRWF